MKHQIGNDTSILLGKVFGVVFGCFLGLALLKFGTPSVLDRFVVWPENGWEWVLNVWPFKIALGLSVVVGLCGLGAARRPAGVPVWLLVMPLGWFVWEWFSALQSVDAVLSRGVLFHFGVCVGCFYAGVFCLNQEGLRRFFLFPLLVAFGLMLWVGFSQHFGSLEETRRYFWAYIYPTMPNVPPEYIKKMQSDRIFATVFYPNALAGALLLLSPGLLSWVWCGRERFTLGARVFLCGVLGAGSLGCLYWSGSKGGWLLGLLIGFVVLLHQRFSRGLKVGLIILFLVAGGTGFYWKNRAYMERGATSVVARLDYWRAAWGVAKDRPVLGSGPGTFGVMYLAVKRPESEMARLTHNDYLQQASDSGFPGMLAYVVLVGGILWVGYGRLDWNAGLVECGVWLGVLAWALQSSFEFTLYVPALGWTAFAFGGWLLGWPQETIRQKPSSVASLLRR